nr:calcium-binding protein [Nostoc sp. 'Peltigera membranacea cyanobiont' 213]
MILSYSTGDNLLNGGDGNDSLSTTESFGYNTPSGNNTLNGGAGNDILSVDGSTGDNLLNGGDGNDILTYISYQVVGRNTLNGGNGDDLFFLSVYPSYLETTPSDLVIQTVDGGTGKDTLSVSYQSDPNGITTTFNATTNIGSITPSRNQVSFKNIEELNITGTAYNDYLVGSNGNDSLDGGRGGNDTIIGGAGNDSLRVFDSSGNSLFSGGDGDDKLSVGGSSSGNNLLSGGDGNDSLNVSGYFDGDMYGAASGNNTLNGGAGDDYLSIGISKGNNLLSGGDGNDSLSVSTDYETFYTAAGNNTLNGGAGDDYLSVSRGSTGDNLLSGNDGDDTLSASGASGNNTLYGGNGNDILTGGKGNDTIYGGAGIDTFAFGSYNEGIETISDFNATNELIQVSAAGFGGGLSTSSVQKSQFTIGASATTSAQRFIYDSTTGGLYFDQDGSAPGFTQVKFAQLSAGLSLTENNFVLVY